MTTREQTQGSGAQPQSKWVRPLVPLAIIVASSIVLLYVGGFIASVQGYNFELENSFTGESSIVGPLWWVPALGGVLAVGARYLLGRTDVDIAAAVVWGALGVFIGIGFAAFGGIIQNGTSPAAAFFGEFVPAAGSNLVNVIILLPILLVAWNAARARSGR